MERARATWTDERLDDLARNVETGFNRVHEDLRSLSARIDARGDGADRRFESVDRRFDSLDNRLDSLQRLVIQLSGGMFVAILATLVSVIVTGT